MKTVSVEKADKFYASTPDNRRTSKNKAIDSGEQAPVSVIILHPAGENPEMFLDSMHAAVRGINPSASTPP